MSLGPQPSAHKPRSPPCWLHGQCSCTVRASCLSPSLISQTYPLTQNVQGYLMDRDHHSEMEPAVKAGLCPAWGGATLSGGEGVAAPQGGEGCSCRDREEAWGWGSGRGHHPRPPQASAVSWEPTPNTPDTCIGLPHWARGHQEGQGCPCLCPRATLPAAPRVSPVPGPPAP